MLRQELPLTALLPRLLLLPQQPVSLLLSQLLLLPFSYPPLKTPAACACVTRKWPL
jgi:hypothetical protein